MEALLMEEPQIQSMDRLFGNGATPPPPTTPSLVILKALKVHQSPL